MKKIKITIKNDINDKIKKVTIKYDKNDKIKINNDIISKYKINDKNVIIMK